MFRLCRRVVILTLRGYRCFLSPFLPPSCRFFPTCSAYALEAMERHGVRKGAWLVLCRLFRCHPWSAGGYDPVC